MPMQYKLSTGQGSQRALLNLIPKSKGPQGHQLVLGKEEEVWGVGGGEGRASTLRGHILQRRKPKPGDIKALAQGPTTNQD